MIRCSVAALFVILAFYYVVYPKVVKQQREIKKHISGYTVIDVNTVVTANGDTIIRNWKPKVQP